MRSQKPAQKTGAKWKQTTRMQRNRDRSPTRQFTDTHFDRIEDIEDICFFEVNTKYISSSAVKKISIFHECVARVKMLIFSPHEMKYIWYLPKKVNFLFIFYSTEIQKSKPNFLLGRFMFDLTFAVCLLGITLGGNVVCT